MSHTFLPKNLPRTSALFREGAVEYTKLAAEAFPVPASTEAGTRLENTDTGDRYIWSGTNWIQTHAKGRVITEPHNYGTSIILGEITGASVINKFGYRTSTALAAGEQTIWATTTNFSVMTTADTFDITYNAATDGAATTGALSLLVSYLDANEDEQEATHVLGNTGTDTTAFSALGINRVRVISSGTANTNTNDILFADNAGTFGTQGVIPALGGVTQQGILHLPRNTIPILKYVFFNTTKQGGGTPTVLFKGYIYSRVLSTTFEVFRATLDTGVDSTLIFRDPTFFPFSASDVLYFVMDTDTNNTVASIRFSLELHHV